VPPAFIGIEIGGTKLQAGVGCADGQLASCVRTQVHARHGAGGIRAALPQLVARALAEAGHTLDAIRAVGIGFGGPYDARRGRTLHSFQIEGWDDFPLQAWAEAQWGRPVRVGNDAHVAGFGEARHGAGRGRSRVFYITAGSGVGGGWIVNGQIDAGQGLGAAEIGHTWVPNPATGAPVELEQICSGWSIGRRAREVAAHGATRMTELAGGVDAIDAKVVNAAAEQGDAAALQILDQAAATFGLAIANVVNLLHPEVVILGGGVALMGPRFWEPLRQAVHARAMAPLRATVEIVPAALGETVVVVGACCLAARAG
jgi:glucokinase